MQGIGQYVLSIGIAALIVGILSELTDCKSSIGILIRMVCGLFLAITVIKPLCSLNYSYLISFGDSFTESAYAAAAVGEEMAEDARRRIIIEQTEAYILDKASSYDLQLEVQVTLSEGEQPLPETVLIVGSASPYARTSLQLLITNELGIPKERLIWTG